MYAWIVIVFGFAVIILYDRKKTLEQELKQKQEFIDKYLFVVNFPSKHYVLPYVWGTKQKEVFYLLSDPRASKALYETISTEDAKRRITDMHLAEMEELDRLGV